MNREQAVFARALADVLNDRLARLRANGHAPDLAEFAEKLSERPAVVDMTPVAAALDRLTASLERRDRLFADLVQKILDRPVAVPAVNPTFTASPAPPADTSAVTAAVAGLSDLVAALLKKLAEDKPRRPVAVEVKHDDGTVSTVRAV